MARQLESEVEVQASPERVWEVLTDFAAYPDWNPSIVRAGGRPAPAAGSSCGCASPAAGRPPSVPGSWRPSPPAGSAGSATCWCRACSTASIASPSSPPGRACVTQQETFRGLLARLLLAFIAGPPRRASAR